MDKVHGHLVMLYAGEGLWVVNRVGNWKASAFFSELHTISPPLLWTDPPLDLQRCSKGGCDTKVDSVQNFLKLQQNMKIIIAKPAQVLQYPKWERLCCHSRNNLISM